MRRSYTAVLLTATIFAACGAPAEGPGAPDQLTDLTDSVSALPRERLAVAPPLSIRGFHSEEGVLDSIHVLRAGRAVQTLVPGGDVDPAPHPGEDVDTVDINFDGHPDVRQQTIWGATGNAAYGWWLFDASAGRFVEAPEFGEKIQGHTVDRQRREITVRSSGGHAGAIFEEDVYQPRGRDLIRVRSTHQDWNPETERYLRTVGRLDAGQWVERTDTFTMETLPSADSTGT
jgi:hypothetical protein